MASLLLSYIYFHHTFTFHTYTAIILRAASVTIQKNVPVSGTRLK